MPLSVMLFIVSTLMVIGIISLTDALIRLILRSEQSPKSVDIWISDSCDTIECTLKHIVVKYPDSKIIINSTHPTEETKQILKIIKRTYPNISLKEH